MLVVKVAPSKKGSAGKRGWFYIDSQPKHSCDMPKIHVIQDGNSICFHNIKSPDKLRSMNLDAYMNHEFSCHWCKEQLKNSIAMVQK